MAEGTTGIVPLGYVRPGPDELGGRRKKIVRLPGTAAMRADVQVIGEGGENNLHSHTHTDGLWFVLSGRVTFHDADGPVGTFGPHDGVLVPRGTRYWFENASEEVSEILHVAVSEPGAGIDRVDHEPMTAEVLANFAEHSGGR